jgi:DNA-damage-inducible protein J
MKTETVNVTMRMEKELKEQADALFEDMGLSLNAACRMFLKRAVLEQRIPFEVRRVDRKTLQAISDAEQGKNVSGSFDSVDALMEDLEK